MGGIVVRDSRFSVITARTIIFASLAVAAVPSVLSANVDLFFVPSVVFSPGVNCPSNILTVQLRARSNTPNPEMYSSVSVILQWDPAVLQLTMGDETIPNTSPNYQWSFEFFPDDGTVNNTYADGDAFYDAFGQITDPPSAPANNTNGMLVTTFKFKVLAPSTGTVLSMVPSRGSVQTQVIGTAADDITGDISSTTTFKIANTCKCGLGDVNVDGVYTDADIAAAVDVLLGNDTTPSHISELDFNCDGVADGLDIQGFTDFMLLAL